MPPDDKAPRTEIDMSGAVSLDQHVTIFPNAPMPEYDAAGGKAYLAKARSDSKFDHIAVVCPIGAPVRSNYANSMKTVDNPSILNLRESGPVYWPPARAQCFALIYEKPLLPRFWKTLGETHPPFGEDALNRTFLTPMVMALTEFQRIGATHGGIRLTNIFWRDGAASPPQLGDFMSTPPGFNQPVLFETIERAHCPPAGRGLGSTVDDTYALGVCVALMVQGHNPLQHLDDHAILQMKLDKGSFNTFVGGQRLAGGHIALLRGLLTDDARQRWNANDLHEWLTGRRLTPKNAELVRRANRSFNFLGKDFWLVKPLSAALASNPQEASKVIETKALGRWVVRSLDDQRRAKDLDEAIDGLKESGKSVSYQNQLTTRACIALDPPSPIRYRGLAVMPDGIAGLLSDTIIKGESPQLISEIITCQFVTFWVNSQRDAKVELVPFAQQLEHIRVLIERPQLGCGVERAAYELNPTMPCLSPMLRGEYVITARALLPALERIAAQPNRPAEPMDRHIAAFLVSHDRRGEQIFEQMSPPHTPQKRALALLALYSEMQYRFGPDHLPEMSKWLLSLLESSVSRFFNRPFQDKVRHQLKEVADKGQLSRLEKLLDDPERLSKDESEFLMARLIYQNVQKEIAELNTKISSSNIILVTVGRPLAATISSFFAILMVSLVVVRAFWRLLF